MSITLAPTETQKTAASNIVRQAVTGLDSGGIFGSIYGDTPDYNRTLEQLKAYSGWTYVVVRKFCEIISGQAPLVGLADRPKAIATRQTARQRTRWERQRWNQLYGATYQVDAEDVVPVDQHPLVELLERCNDEDTWADLSFELNLYLELTGCSYLWAVPSRLTLANGAPFPAELSVVPTHWVTEQRHRDGTLIGWEVDNQSGAKPIPLGPLEIIPFKMKSPLSKNGWTSPTQATDVWHDGSTAIGRSRVATMANQGNPSMIIKPDKEVWGDLDDDEARALQARIAGRRRSINQHGQDLVLPPGIDAERWSDKVAEMNYIESDEQLRDALFAARGLSKFIVGITKDMNRSDVDAAMAHACEFTANPRLRFIAGRMTEKLAKRWDPNLLVWFPDCTPESWERELEESRLDGQLGAITPDERRAARGREEFNRPESQTPLVSSSTLPLWSDSDEVDEDEDENQHAAGELF